jgi:hypothetical protein
MEYEQDGSLAKWVSTQRTTGSCSSVDHNVGGLDEEDSKPSPVKSSSTLTGLDHPGQEVVPEEATTTPGVIPFGWIRVKLEPDC